MRNKNRYERNRNFRINSWNRIRNAEQPYKTHMPYYGCNGDRPLWTAEEQIRQHFDHISKEARRLDGGSHRPWDHAPSWFRRRINKIQKARERSAMSHIRQGEYDVEIPKFKRNVRWLWT